MPYKHPDLGVPVLSFWEFADDERQEIDME